MAFNAKVFLSPAPLYWIWCVNAFRIHVHQSQMANLVPNSQPFALHALALVQQNWVASNGVGGPAWCMHYIAISTASLPTTCKCQLLTHLCRLQNLYLHSQWLSVEWLCGIPHDPFLSMRPENAEHRIN